MSKIYFTSDYHFGNPNIVKYCNRPFKNAERMTDVLIKFANQRAKGYFEERIVDAVTADGETVKIKTKVKVDSDVLIHVGDFACYGAERGISGSKKNPREYLSKFDAKVICLEGNHDHNNRVKNQARSMVMDICSFRDVTVGHYPTNYREAIGTFHSHHGRHLGLHICGHVHKAWKHFYDKKHNILNINVGCDVWNYQVVSEQDIVEYVGKVRKELGI